MSRQPQGVPMTEPTAPRSAEKAEKAGVRPRGAIGRLARLRRRASGTVVQGVQGRGPSLLGVGEAAVYFQVATGRMPASGQGAQEPRKPPKYTEDEVNQIAAYVQSVGGGPQLPGAEELRSRDTKTLGEGGE